MPDTKGIDTPYKDYIGTKPSYTIKETLGSDPTAPIPSDAGVTGQVTPKPLPTNTLDFTR